MKSIAVFVIFLLASVSASAHSPVNSTELPADGRSFHAAFRTSLVADVVKARHAGMSKGLAPKNEVFFRSAGTGALAGLAAGCVIGSIKAMMMNNKTDDFGNAGVRVDVWSHVVVFGFTGALAGTLVGALIGAGRAADMKEASVER